MVTDAGTWTATANHPVWVEGKGWTDAVDLTTGDQLVGSTGGLLVVQAMHDRGWLSGQTVHNLHVAGTHTYYIASADGSVDALVHNCGSGRVHGNSLASLRTTALYRLDDGQGNLLTWGITSRANPRNRYSETYLADKKFTVLATGSRRSMARIERWMVQYHRGPLNRERWFGGPS